MKTSESKKYIRCSALYIFDYKTEMLTITCKSPTGNIKGCVLYQSSRDPYAINNLFSVDFVNHSKPIRFEIITSGINQDTEYQNYCSILRLFIFVCNKNLKDDYYGLNKYESSDKMYIEDTILLTIEQMNLFKKFTEEYIKGTSMHMLPSTAKKIYVKAAVIMDI